MARTVYRLLHPSVSSTPRRHPQVLTSVDLELVTTTWRSPNICPLPGPWLRTVPPDSINNRSVSFSVRTRMVCITQSSPHTAFDYVRTSICPDRHVLAKLPSQPSPNEHGRGSRRDTDRPALPRARYSYDRVLWENRQTSKICRRVQHVTS